MEINENINLNGTIEITGADGSKKPAVAVNSNLTKNGGNFNFSFNIIDNIVLESNVAEVQTEIDSFLNTLKAKMIELNYKVTI